MKQKFTKMAVLALISGGLCFTGCSPKYTASFNKSRNFHDAEPQVTHVEKEVKEVKSEPVITEEQQAKAVASTDKNVIRELAEIPSIKKIVQEHKANVNEIKESGSDQKTIEKEIRKEEKRAHKEVKKQLVKELKEIKKVNDTEATKAMNQKIFIGIVIAAAGIIIAILASGGLGAVAIIVGVGLIAWGIIEQGGV